MHACVCACVHVYVCVCMCAYMYVMHHFIYMWRCVYHSTCVALVSGLGVCPAGLIGCTNGACNAISLHGDRGWL